MNKKHLFSFLCFVLITTSGRAQQNLGVATGSYNRINSMYLNPANIADSGEKITINIISINAGVDNSLGTISQLGNLGKMFNGNDSNSQSFFSGSGKKNFSMMAPAVSIHGPGLIVSINKKNSIAITTGIRVMNQFNNFSPSLYNTITNGGNTSTSNFTLSNQKFNWTASIWNEVGISYGGVFIDKPASQLKVGVTLRRLGGIGYISLKGNNLDLRYPSGSDSFYASHSDLEFASNVISDNSAVFNGAGSGNVFNSFLGANAGSGLGADVGVVYSHRFGNLDPVDYMESDVTHNLVLSASVTDMGAIKYKQNTNSIINVTGNGYLTGQGLSNNINDFTSFKNYIKQQGFTADTSSAATKVHMPTALILSADYQLKERFFVNGTFIGNLANRQNFGNSYYSQVTITPRYDFRLMSFGIPISYSWLAHDLKAGIGFRISGFFIGSDDMLALFANHQYGFNAYMGGYIRIKFKKKKRLEDHDHWERFVQ